MTLTVYRNDGSPKAAQTQLVGDAPAGSVVTYAGTNIPSDWLLCDGRAVARVAYSDLFNAIGTTYGAGDGSTTFNLPNYVTAMDTWHTVGAVGEPAFAAGWTAIAPEPVAFRKFSDGVVRIKGFVQGPIDGGAVFTLPVGYRPPSMYFIRTIIEGESASFVTHARAYVDKTTGAVTIDRSDSVAGNFKWDLAPLTFDTESATINPVGGLPTGLKRIIRAFPPSKTVAPLGPAIQDEGVAVASRAAINLIGANVAATDDAANNRVNVTVSIPTVTTLPVSPVDGQEIYFLVSDLGDVVSGIWHLRYRATSMQPYKWEFAGGEPMFRELDGSVAGTTTNVWTGRDGPTLTVPLAGVYEVSWGAQMTGIPTTAFIWQMGISVNNGTPAVDDYIQAGGPSSAGASFIWNASREMVRTYAKNDVLAFWYMDVNVTAGYKNRFFRLRPRRVA
jgi:hypothetical protein